jgi:hypothetical protein
MKVARRRTQGPVEYRILAQILEVPAGGQDGPVRIIEELDLCEEPLDTLEDAREELDDIMEQAGFEVQTEN